MSRILRSGLVALALLLSLLIVPIAGAAPGDGNSDTAKLCQDGGFANYVRLDGTAFKNTGDCVSYAAQGGQLVPLSAALPCLNGGYSDYLTTGGATFTSQAECVAYVGNGGTLVAKPTATLTVTTRSTTAAFFVNQVTGTGLKPNSPVYLQPIYIDGGTQTVRFATTTAEGRTFFTVTSFCGQYRSAIVYSFTPTGEIITADFPVTC